MICPICGKATNRMVYPKNGNRGCSTCLSIHVRNDGTLFTKVCDGNPGHGPITEAYVKELSSRPLVREGENVFVDRSILKNRKYFT